MATTAVGGSIPIIEEEEEEDDDDCGCCCCCCCCCSMFIMNGCGGTVAAIVLELEVELGGIEIEVGVGSEWGSD